MCEYFFRCFASFFIFAQEVAWDVGDFEVDVVFVYVEVDPLEDLFMA